MTTQQQMQHLADQYKPTTMHKVGYWIGSTWEEASQQYFLNQKTAASALMKQALNDALDTPLAALTPAYMATLARATADMLDQKGWCQRQFTNQQGQHCIVGALRVIAPNRVFLKLGLDWIDLYDTFLRQLAAWLQEHHPQANEQTSGYGVPGWNDRVFTSHEDVAAWLHKFADFHDPR